MTNTAGKESKLTFVKSACDRPAEKEEVETAPAIAWERLAEVLHWKMEHLDPSDEGLSWAELDENDKDYYRLCIEAILVRRDLLRAALGVD